MHPCLSAVIVKYKDMWIIKKTNVVVLCYRIQVFAVCSLECWMRLRHYSSKFPCVIVQNCSLPPWQKMILFVNAILPLKHENALPLELHSLMVILKAMRQWAGPSVLEVFLYPCAEALYFPDNYYCGHVGAWTFLYKNMAMIFVLAVGAMDNMIHVHVLYVWRIFSVYGDMIATS